MIELIEATDTHFDWLLSGASIFGALRQPACGVDQPDVLTLLRGIAATPGCRMWLIVRASEVCGLCGYMKPPIQGCAEIGYGVAPSCRAQGLASQAVAAMLADAPNHAVHMLVAGTAKDNRASQIVLERNGFSRTGTRTDPEDGEMVDWCRRLKEDGGSGGAGTAPPAFF